MSWSFDFTGTREGVAKAVEAECEKLAANYSGKEEAKDIVAVKERCLSLIASLEMNDWANGVIAKANGSHSTTGSAVICGNFQMSVMRTTLKLS